jgi:transcriptional regulator with XRE-family HTH domain
VERAKAAHLVKRQFARFCALLRPWQLAFAVKQIRHQTMGGAMSSVSEKQPNEVDVHVGRRLRMRRLMLGMSQEKLAGQLHLTFQQVQKYEKGVNRVSASRLQEISRILQVPVPFFFEGAPGPSGTKGPPPTPSYISEFLATADSFVLIRAFTKIKSGQLRRAIVRLVENMADNTR